MTYSVNLLKLKGIEVVSEWDFWKYYMYLMFLFSDEKVNDKELKTLAYTLALSPRVTIYEGDRCKQAMKDLEMSRSSLNIVRRGLLEKGFIVKADDMRGDWVLSPHMEQLQKYYKEKFTESGGFEISLPFIVKEYVSDK